MVNYDEDEYDNERSTLLNPEQGNVDSLKKNIDMISVSAVKNENLGNTGYSNVSYTIRHLQSWSIHTSDIRSGK